MAITGVRIISVPVIDQDRSARFFSEVLGATIFKDAVVDPQMRWLELGFGDSYPHFALVTWFEQLTPGSFIGTVLETDNLEGDVARLDQYGVEASPIESAPWGRYCTFSDLDGNGWILQTTNS